MEQNSTTPEVADTTLFAGEAWFDPIEMSLLADGGEVLGHVVAPNDTADFSSYLLRAQSSGADVIGLANSGGDMVNSVKQAAEFGIAKRGQRLAGLLIYITDVHSIGLEYAQACASSRLSTGT